MAVIAQTSGVLNSGSNGATNLTRTALTASDTLSYTRGAGLVLGLYNTTAAAVTVTLVGSAPTNLTPDGFGGVVSTAAGKQIQVPASGLTIVELDDIWAFLTGTGTVTVTGGTGLVAFLFN